MKAPEWIASIFRTVRAASAYTIVLRLTLILLLLYGSNAVYVYVPLIIICGIMLLFPPTLMERNLWMLLVASLASGAVFEWYAIDNHKYLILYWTLACTLSLYAPTLKRSLVLRNAAQILIGLVFFFAALWKVVGGEYWNGEFLYFTFLTDSRVQYVSAMVSGYSLELLALNDDLVDYMTTVSLVDVPAPVTSSVELHWFTLVMSWLTIAGEGTIAAVHLIPSQRLYRVRHTVLMGFIAFTYFLLPVVGFAFVLTVLGFASCEDGDERTRFEYLLLFGIIHIALIPWDQLIAAMWM